MAVGSAVSALNRPGWIRKAQQVFTARFALISCTQASASFTSKSRADLEVRIKEGQWPQVLA